MQIQQVVQVFLAITQMNMKLFLVIIFFHMFSVHLPTYRQNAQVIGHTNFFLNCA